MLLTTAASTAIVHAAAATALHEYAGVGIALLYLVTAVRLSERSDPSLARFGLELGGLLGGAPQREARGDGRSDASSGGGARIGLRARAAEAAREVVFAAGVALVVFPLFAVGFRLWFGWLGAPARPFALTAPADALTFVLNQFLVVALPEEAFFRGYMQTRLADAWPARRVRVLGADMPLGAWLGASALFGVVHVLADLSLARFSVFFPGLLFGWMREKRGGIGAALTLHALSNVFSETLRVSWFE